MGLITRRSPQLIEVPWAAGFLPNARRTGRMGAVPASELACLSLQDAARRVAVPDEHSAGVVGDGVAREIEKAGTSPMRRMAPSRRMGGQSSASIRMSLRPSATEGYRWPVRGRMTSFTCPRLPSSRAGAEVCR